jgi:hypothetical protein
VNAKDSGDYKVIAKNLHGESHANIKLNIQTNKLDKYESVAFFQFFNNQKYNFRLPDGIAPHFASKPKIIQDQKKLVIEIEIKAQPTPSVSWYLNDKDLSESTNGHFVVKSSKKSSDLYLVQLEINVNKQITLIKI